MNHYRELIIDEPVLTRRGIGRYLSTRIEVCDSYEYGEYEQEVMKVILEEDGTVWEEGGVWHKDRLSYEVAKLEKQLLRLKAYLEQINDMRK